MIDFSNVKKWNIGSNDVIKAELNGTVVWRKPLDPIYKIPFYVEDRSGSANTLTIKKNGSTGDNAPTLTVLKSTDGTTWTSMGNTSVNGITVTVPANGRLYLSCNTDRWSVDMWDNYGNEIFMSGNFAVGGNIMSLLYGSNFTGYERSFPTQDGYTFSSLLRGYSNYGKLVDADNLVLPVTTLTPYCYYAMFEYQTLLRKAPKLPATTLAQTCYFSMFEGCTSLTTAPSLPATTMAKSCYQSMFEGCTSLTTAPALPATTLAQTCYFSMFEGCTSLTTAPALPATTLAPTCYLAMFEGCTSLMESPILPATTLAGDCYRHMFYGCTHLNHVECHATDISAPHCLEDWVNGVAASGTFVKHPNMTSWPTGDSGIPSGWTVENANI